MSVNSPSGYGVRELSAWSLASLLMNDKVS
jgi:hypothetical protein